MTPLPCWPQRLRGRPLVHRGARGDGKRPGGVGWAAARAEDARGRDYAGQSRDEDREAAEAPRDALGHLRCVDPGHRGTGVLGPSL